MQKKSEHKVIPFDPAGTHGLPPERLTHGVGPRARTCSDPGFVPAESELSDENQRAVVIPLFPGHWEFSADEHQFIVDGEVVGTVSQEDETWYWSVMRTDGWMLGCTDERDSAMRTLEEGWRKMCRRKSARRDLVPSP